MSKTASTMLALGTVAPHFELTDILSGQLVKLPEQKQSSATVIMFICNHCPYVKHVSKELTRLANDFLPMDVRFIAINSNDVSNYPDDSPANMRITADKEQYPFPYLFDETQQIAKAYHAACTPDFYVFDNQLSLVYRGQLDDSRPGNDIPVSGDSVRHALQCLHNKSPINQIQKPSLGCNIKWKQDN